MTNWVIYALRDPRTDEVRYVGGTHRPAKRLREHVSSALSANGFVTRKASWIRELVGLNLKPIAEILERGSGDGCVEAERRWMAHFRGAGSSLTNTIDAGGTPGRTLSADTRARISAALGLRIVGPETRAKMSAAQRGKVISEQHKAALAAAHRGRKMSIETRAKLSAAHKGRSSSPEHVAKVAAANRGQKRTGQARAHIIEGNRRRFLETPQPVVDARVAAMIEAWRGKRHSDESRAKMSAVRRGQKLSPWSDQSKSRPRESHSKSQKPRR